MLERCFALGERGARIHEEEQGDGAADPGSRDLGRDACKTHRPGSPMPGQPGSPVIR